jgi:hypothetical protein
MKNTAFIIIFVFAFHIKSNAQAGCSDPFATNYNSNAVQNDGSCAYASASVAPISSYKLDTALIETSGLIEWNGSLYTHNDNTDTNIYQINKTDGSIKNIIPLPNITNIDWEEISQDENFIYIGDFGNNATGNRTDLKIYKVKKSSLLTTPQIETINYSYSDQTDFTAKTANSTDFDCESMIVASDGIYLFTKQWLSKKTTIYKLVNTPGTQKANPIATIDIAGLATGATLQENLHIIAICGYNEILSPFIYLIYDFKKNDFVVSNKRKINVSLPAHQIEGIATLDGLEYFLTNEKFERLPFVSNPQKLHKISLDGYLEKYLTTLSIADLNGQLSKGIIYPNPTYGEIKIDLKDEIGQEYKILDTAGKIVKTGILNSYSVNLDNFSKGIYFFTLQNSKKTYKIIKI